MQWGLTVSRDRRSQCVGYDRDLGQRKLFLLFSKLGSNSPSFFHEPLRLSKRRIVLPSNSSDMIFARVLKEIELEVLRIEPTCGEASTPGKFIPRDQPSEDIIMIVK